MEKQEEVIQLIQKYNGTKKTILPNTTMQSLHWVSDDIDDFFAAYKVKFKVDMSEYNYYDYFWEDVHPLHIIRDLFRRVFTPDRFRKREISVAFLTSVATSGRWVLPEE